MKRLWVLVPVEKGSVFEVGCDPEAYMLLTNGCDMHMLSLFE